MVGCRQDAESSQPKADKNYYESAPDPRISTSPQTEPQVSGAISHSAPIGGDIASDDLSGNLLPRTAPESLDEAVDEYKARGIIEQIDSHNRGAILIVSDTDPRLARMLYKTAYSMDVTPPGHVWSASQKPANV